MRVTWDKEEGCMYIYRPYISTIYINESKQIIESEEVKEGVILDFDKDNNIVGIELLGVKEDFSFDQVNNVTVLGT